MCGFGDVFRHGICDKFRYDNLVTHVGWRIFRDIGEDHATRTRHSSSPTRNEGPDAAEETAEKIAHPVPSLKVERGWIERANPRNGGKTATRLIEVVRLLSMRRN